jgi:Uncharacterized protein conserved in bacteria
MSTPSVELHVVSDATGETAARLVLALEAQFPDQEFLEIRHPRVETVADLQLAVERMKGRPAVVVYTLVEPELRDTMRACAAARSSTTATSWDTRSRPWRRSRGRRAHEAAGAAAAERGVLPADVGDRVRREVRRRRRLGLHDADIVLVGVSRTSKTPLSIYLGYLGYKTANVPLVKGIDPPPELFKIDQTKIVGLTIDAKRLAEIRGERLRWMRGGNNYADLVEIYDELDYAAQIHRRLGCPCSR